MSRHGYRQVRLTRHDKAIVVFTGSVVLRVHVYNEQERYHHDIMRMKHALFVCIAFLALLSLRGMPLSTTSAEEKINYANCTVKGFKLYGKIQVVTSFPDVKVEIVTTFPDLKVKVVDVFPDACGKWQLVDTFPDTKVQFVHAFPDVKIQYVDTFPGKP